MVETCKLPNGYAGYGAKLCFLNSVTQMLLATPGGMARLETHAQQCGSDDTCTTCRLSKCLHGCAAAGAGSADITDIVAHLQDFGFCHEAWQQEDAGEVLEALLQNMTPEVSNRFEVQTTIKTTCAFGHTIRRDDACKLFQVQVAGKVGLQDMVDGTLAEERVDHRCDTCVLGVDDVLGPVCKECNRIVHEYHRSSTCVKGDSGCMGLVHPCTDCIGAALRHSSAQHNCMRKPTESLQQMFVRKAPQHLVVHQKGFGYNKQQQAPYKLFDGCDVNRVLYMSDPHARKRHRYEIIGVVAHDGADTACAGHYVWLRFDDRMHGFVDVVSDDAMVVHQHYSDACKKYQPYLVLCRYVGSDSVSSMISPAVELTGKRAEPDSTAKGPITDTSAAGNRQKTPRPDASLIPAAVPVAANARTRIPPNYYDILAMDLDDVRHGVQKTQHHVISQPAAKAEHMQHGDEKIAQATNISEVDQIFCDDGTAAGQDVLPMRGSNVYGFHLWQSQEHHDYLQKLQSTNAWLDETDMMIGRLEIRRAMQVAGPKHLPVRDFIVPNLQAVIQGLQANGTGFVAMRALRMATENACQPTFVFGDNSHWRCICVSQCHQTVYCIDPFGEQNFPSDVIDALSKACESIFEQTGVIFNVKVSAMIFQADSYSCGPLALFVVEAWEKYVEISVNTDFLVYLQRCTTNLTQNCGGNNAQFMRMLRSKLLQRGRHFHGRDARSTETPSPQSCFSMTHIQMKDVHHQATTPNAQMEPKQQSPEAGKVVQQTHASWTPEPTTQMEQKQQWPEAGRLSQQTRATWTHNDEDRVKTALKQHMHNQQYMLKTIESLRQSGDLTNKTDKQIKNKIRNMHHTKHGVSAKKRMPCSEVAQSGKKRRKRPQKKADPPPLSLEDAVAEFNKRKCMAPSHTCCCCERLFFPSSLRTLTTEFLQKLQQDETTRSLFDNLQYSDGMTNLECCSTCYNNLDLRMPTTGLWASDFRRCSLMSAD